MGMAMGKWREVAAEAARQQFMMGGALTRMLHRALSMGFEKWQYEAAEMKRQQEVMDKALRRLRNAKLYSGWNQWRSWAAEMRRQQFMMDGASEAVGCMGAVAVCGCCAEGGGSVGWWCIGS